MTGPSDSPALADRCFAFAYRHRWRGLHRVRRWWIAAGGSRTVRHRNRYGALFDLRPGDYIDRFVLEQGYYESEVLDAVRPHLGPGAVFWDIGANFGLHAVTAARLVPGTVVHAFEPSVISAARLRRHSRLNAVDLTLWPLALGDSPGYARLHTVDDGNPGANTLHPWHETTYTGTEPVRVERADVLVATAGLPAPAAIKLDVEGGELAVLAGLGERLRAPSLRLVVFEAADNLPPSDPIRVLLHSAGFIIEPLVRNESTGHLLVNYRALRR